MSHLPGSPPSPLKTTSQRGIALLITLVILALLAVFMTEFAFETKLETRGIQNYQASFKARNAVKSMFKAVLEGLKGQDEVKFFRVYLKDLLRLGATSNEISFLNPPQPVGLPAGVIADFPEVSFYTPVIRPIDHLYNLNRINPISRTRIPETKADVLLANQFINILKKWNSATTYQPGSSVPSYNIQLNTNDILPIYAAIFDWLDKDNEIYYSSNYGTIGAEKNSYISADPYFEIKNNFLDKLSEVQLIRGVKGKRIPLDQWKKGFTTYQVGENYCQTINPCVPKYNHAEIKPRINVNLATFEEIVKFLEQFDQNTAYFINYSPGYHDSISQDYFKKSEEIAAELTKQPRSKLTSEDIKNKLSNITQYDRSGDFFIPYSYWYEIQLKTEIDNVKAEVRAVVSVDRNAATGNVTNLIIHNFFLR
ncbi:type II secretion system protein GspK [bacterium]|nr:type II secretion system protein GspK [bacterium]